MGHYSFNVLDENFWAMGSGALWWPSVSTLLVSDLHLGKSERIARRGGALLPPYDGATTLQALSQEIATLEPRRVICLGDSFDDDLAARHIDQSTRDHLLMIMIGRDWIWISGNHDPSSNELGGDSLQTLCEGRFSFRHVPTGAPGEIAGHFHPKASITASGQRITRKCFLTDGARVILPAFGAYTGGLDWHDPVFDPLFNPKSWCILTGSSPQAFPRRELA